MDSAQDSYKKWGIAFIIFLLILIPVEIGLTRPNAIENLKEKLGLETAGKPKSAIIENKGVLITQAKEEEGPGLYFLELIYDPVSGKLSEEKSGHTIGHQPPLETEPSKSQETFSYKVEVEVDNEIVSSGWEVRFKDFITKNDGKYHFKVSSPYISEAKIKIYSVNGEKLLEEVMQ